MAQPLQPRRTSRNPEPRRLYSLEQAHDRREQLEAREIQRAIAAAAATAEASDSAEEELPDEQRADPNDDAKAHPSAENTPPWSRQLHSVHPPACTAIPVSTLPRHHARTELGFLQAYMDPALIQHFVTNTNLYAAARQAVAWVDTTTDEIWRYLAVRIRQGIVDLPELHMYWAHGYRDEYIVQLMVRDRFMALHRYFHIEPPVDRDVRENVVVKTARFYHQCQRLFKAYYEPGQNFAVDETMIRFQGRSAWITVIRAKPVPVGFKLYTVASDGYLLDFRIFRGKGGRKQKESVLHHTVVDLVTPWKDSNRWLFFDNLYTSPALCDHLLLLGIRSCGTCRPNRAELPDDLYESMARLKKNKTSTWQRGQLGCLVWNDAKPVPFLSTHCTVSQMTDIPATHGREATRRPTVAVDYNNNKSHVDQVDQLRSYYVVERRTRRTWPALAWWLLDTCISNAYKLWCLETNEQGGILHFREHLLTQIAAAYPSHLTHVQSAAPPAVHQPFVGHWPEHHSDKRDCAHCSGGRKRRRKTYFRCRVCGVHLHPTDCFGAYHDRLGIDNRQV